MTMIKHNELQLVFKDYILEEKMVIAVVFIA